MCLSDLSINLFAAFVFCFAFRVETAGGKKHQMYTNSEVVQAICVGVGLRG